MSEILAKLKRLIGPKVKHDRIEREPVCSASVTSIGFNERTERLQVEYKTGHIYEFDDVCAKTAMKLRDADSFDAMFTKTVDTSKHHFIRMTYPLN